MTAGPDRGLSFVEVLIAVVLLGLAVVGVIPAFTAQVHGSALQDRLAGSRRWIVSAGDYAVSASLPHTVCATPASYQSAIRTAVQNHRPSGWSDSLLTVAEVEYWNGTTFSGTCTEVAAPALRLQQITLRVSSPDGTVDERLQVVKAGG